MTVRLFCHILLVVALISVSGTLAFSTSDGSDVESSTSSTEMTSDDTSTVDASKLSATKGPSTKQAMQPAQVSTDGNTADASSTAPSTNSEKALLGGSTWKVTGEQEIPPTITHPDSSATVIVGSQESPFIFQCRASGSPRPSFRWYRGDQEITERGDYLKAYPNGTLHIRDFSRRENGWYQCTATNRYGTSLSNVFHLVRETDTLKVPENSSTTTLKPWQQYSVPCSNVPVTYPKVNVRWYNKDNDQIRTDDRIGQDESGTLHLAYVTKNDHDSIFSCGLVTSLTRTIFMAKMGHLLITEPNTPLVGKRPSIQYSTGYVEAIIGQDMILECFVAGVPLAEIKWKNSSNHEIVPNQNPRFQLFDHNRKLKVGNVNVNDEGIFSCQGSNAAGTEEGAITVNVTSPPIPKPAGALISQTVPDNQVVTLKCKTKAAPSESVNEPIWYRNGRLLTRGNVPDADRYAFSTDMTELTIRDLNKEVDIANFQCNVTNSKGFRFFDAYLRIIDSIEISKRPSNENIITPDDMVDFTVRAKGDRCCNINTLWYFNSTQIDINLPPFVLKTSTNSLYFDAASVPLDALKNWMGKYTCRVSDFYQKVSVNVVVRLKEEDKKPEPVTAEKASIGLWWVGVLCGMVAIIIAIIIVLVIIYKRKNPGETYKLEQQELKHNLNPEEDLLNQSFQDI